MSDYSELKRLAELATPGPWKYWGEVGHEIFGPVHGGSGSRCFRLNHEARVADAEFIAAANPEVVLSLISDNQTAQSQLAALREELDEKGRDEMVTKLEDQNVELRQRLADAERRNGVHSELLKSISTCYGAVLSLYTLEKISAALNPNPEAASHEE